MPEEDDPNDPRHPDHDLSESAPYLVEGEPFKYSYESYRGPWFTRRWVMLIFAVLIIVGLVLPFLL